MSITPERAEIINFTGKYYGTPAKFVTSNDMMMDILSDYAGANDP